jgi:hypothetical protein
MKLIRMKIIKIFLIISLFNFFNCQEDQLQVNILPSDKYKLNQRDLVSLKSDIERQVIFLFIKSQCRFS